MEYGICNLSVIPLREKASHKSEMVTQLLFGETYSIIQNYNDWLQIKCDHDQYYGWINRKQHTDISSIQHDKLKACEVSYVIDFVNTISKSNSQIPIFIGSKLYNFDGLNSKFLNQKYAFNGQAIAPGTFEWTDEKIIKTAKKYLNTPYFWGGRSVFGIDCSGFVQNLFHLFNHNLPRDAHQQAEVGDLVNFLKEARTGDLAYFSDELEQINHVGMLLNENQIIHASGCVKIDKIDHYGIFNESSKKYSHKLRIIKRLL